MPDFLQQGGQSLAGQAEVQLLQFVAQEASAGVVAHDQFSRGMANFLRRKRFVSTLVGHQAGAMDARLVAKDR